MATKNDVHTLEAVAEGGFNGNLGNPPGSATGKELAFMNCIWGERLRVWEGRFPPFPPAPPSG